MNRIFSLLCTLALAVTVVTGQDLRCRSATDPNTWCRYTVKGEEFSVALPSLPGMTTSKESERQIPKAGLGRHLRTRLDGIQYGIDVFENPNKHSLDNFVAEYKTNFKDDFTVERNVVLNGVPGKEFSTPASPPAMVQFFATEQRLYRFIAVGPNIDNDAVKHFFSSIMLGKKGEGTNVADGPGMPLELETGERVYKGSEVDKKIRIVHKPEPMYTQKALENQTRGQVVLTAIFSSTGEVTNIHVASALPNGMTEACIDAAKKIEFVPAVKDGKSVSMWMTLEYNFM
jgi:TonB family protein